MTHRIVAMDASYAEDYFERMENATAQERELAFSLFGDDDGDDNELDDILTVEGDTATITIEGPLSMEGPGPLARFLGFGGGSYERINAAIQRVREDDSIKSVVFSMDTPGGEVRGVDDVWQYAKALASEKTLHVENHGMIASAGYWIASPSHDIAATSPVAQTGSIGVVIVTVDDSGMANKIGIKRVVITSRNAPDKYPDVSKKAGRDVLQQRVDSVERVFIDRIAEGRGVSAQYVAENYGRGAVFIARDPAGGQDAISAGLIDRVISPVPARVPTGGPGQRAQGNYQASDSAESSAIEDSEPTGRDAGEENPAQGGTDREAMMGLDEFLAENPAARVELKERLEAEYKRGQEDVRAQAKKAGAFLSADYPDKVKARAVKVIVGESSMDSLEALVDFVDMSSEAKSQAAAETETEEQDETPAQAQSAKSTDGVIRNDVDVEAAKAELRRDRGRE